MATVAQFFAATLVNLDLRDYQDALVNEQRSNLMNRLRSLVRLQRVFASGSHKKRTLVAPLSGTKFAIDMVALLSSELYDSYSMREGGQSQLLQHFRGALSTFPEYSRTTIKGNGQAVTLLLAEFDIDVVPAFSLTRGGYFIPDSRTGVRGLRPIRRNKKPS
jgi:hypothetical protein